MAYHPDTDDYLTRLASAGGSISQFNIDLLDTKIRLFYAKGLRGATNFLDYWLQLNLTESFTGSLVPVYDSGVGNPTNIGFTAGDWDSTYGLAGNATDKYLNSGYSLSTQLGTFTLAGRSDFHLSALQSQFIPAGSGNFEALIGLATTNSDAAEYALWNGQTVDNYFAFGRDSPNAFNPTSGAAGLLLGTASSTHSIRLLVDNSLAASATGSPTTVGDPTINLFMFARNLAGSPDFYSKARISSFTAGYGLTTTQETDLYNILNLTQPYYASPLMLTAC
jgi:hypothetical protein